MILIKLNQCTDDIGLMKKQLKKLKEDIEIIGNGFYNFKTDAMQEIKEDLSIRFGGKFLKLRTVKASFLTRDRERAVPYRHHVYS